ncbi:MAG: hypothetical protein KJZ58_01795 [Flavobacteriales bacterium]|nr:hypothetical protein [Flavobacteriales bacterium]MCL4280971.1 hypothetical protein [Flavobacteriales bacterium]
MGRKGWLVALFLMALGAGACGNRDGAAGTTDGTDEDAYELKDTRNLAPAMDDSSAVAPATASPDTAQGH